MVGEKIKLVVDYTETVKQSISDNNFDWKNEDVNDENFPIPLEMVGKKVEIFVKLFYFYCDISPDEAIAKMNEAGCRPANLMELLALGSLFPDLQRESPIVAFGSVWRLTNIRRFAPYLSEFNKRRGLSLGWFNGVWHAHVCFLGVYK